MQIDIGVDIDICRYGYRFRCRDIKVGWVPLKGSLSGAYRYRATSYRVYIVGYVLGVFWALTTAPLKGHVHVGIDFDVEMDIDSADSWLAP